MSHAELIINPAGGRGKAAKLLPRLIESFAGIGVTAFRETTSPGEEEKFAREAIDRGVTTIIAVGGDGTCSGIANAILSSRSGCRLAVVPAGTGNDFAKSLGVKGWTPEQVARLVERGEPTPIDAGLVDGRYFINSCGFGFDASVLEATDRVRFLRGDAVYIYSALKQLFTYRGVDVSTSVPSVKPGQMLMVVVSSGRWLGGAFKIAPDASVLDGKLDACFFSDSGVVERAKLFLGAMRGTHARFPSVSVASIQQLALTFPSSPLMELDGELRRAQSATVELKCVPRALSVIAAPGAPV